MSAILSRDGRYRYTLTREIADGYGTVLFVMLNPSTADAELDDPTIRRCIGFAESWGYGKLAVANLYAYRATDPRELRRVDNPVGGLTNDFYISELATEAERVVCAWGTRAEPGRVARVIDVIEEAGSVPYCLGHTKSGAPRHPLYLRRDSKLVRFAGATR